MASVRHQGARRGIGSRRWGGVGQGRRRSDDNPTPGEGDTWHGIQMRGGHGGGCSEAGGGEIIPNHCGRSN